MVESSLARKNVGFGGFTETGGRQIDVRGELTKVGGVDRIKICDNVVNIIDRL